MSASNRLAPSGWRLRATLLGLGLLSGSAQAQPQPQLPFGPGVVLFENVSLAPNFRPDPRLVRGLSGGATAASAKLGKGTTETGPCIGFVDDQPDHELTLSGYFNYLSLRVRSGGDTTVVVRGPGGSWCNDDAYGQDPAIVGQWLEGTYQIWVGSYNRDQSLPYVLELSRTEPLPTPTPARPTSPPPRPAS